MFGSQASAESFPERLLSSCEPSESFAVLARGAEIIACTCGAWHAAAHTDSDEDFASSDLVLRELAVLVWLLLTMNSWSPRSSDSYYSYSALRIEFEFWRFSRAEVPRAWRIFSTSDVVPAVPPTSLWGARFAFLCAQSRYPDSLLVFPPEA